jgi:type IV secretory pathway VirB3-like protein
MSIPQDKVFLGVTRPATFAGTHFVAVLANVIFTMYAFVFTDSLWALAVAVPIHGICWAITRYDPHAFRIIGLKLSHMAETLGARPSWRTSSRAPFCRREY